MLVAIFDAEVFVYYYFLNFQIFPSSSRDGQLSGSKVRLKFCLWSMQPIVNIVKPPSLIVGLSPRKEIAKVATFLLFPYLFGSFLLSSSMLCSPITTDIVSGVTAWKTSLGKGPATKTDEFSEKCQRAGGGSFWIQKFILQNLDLHIGFFQTFCENIAIYFFENEGGGGSKAIWNFSENLSDLVAGPFP